MYFTTFLEQLFAYSSHIELMASQCARTLPVTEIIVKAFLLQSIHIIDLEGCFNFMNNTSKFYPKYLKVVNKKLYYSAGGSIKLLPRL